MKPPGDKEIDDTSVYIRTSLTLTPQISKMGWGPTAQDLLQTDKTKSTLYAVSHKDNSVKGVTQVKGRAVSAARPFRCTCGL